MVSSDIGLMPNCRYSSGFAGEVVSSESADCAVVENASLISFDRSKQNFGSFQCLAHRLTLYMYSICIQSYVFFEMVVNIVVII